METALYGYEAFVRASRAAAAAWSRQAYGSAAADARASRFATRCTPNGQGSAGSTRARAYSSGDAAAPRHSTPLPASLKDAYAVLHLQPGAPHHVVKAAYRSLAQVHHPDAGGDTSQMARINAAYAVICRGAS